MPDLHSGYGFAIGNVTAVDMQDPDAVVSPGGVEFDINCGVRECLWRCWMLWLCVVCVSWHVGLFESLIVVATCCGWLHSLQCCCGQIRELPTYQRHTFPTPPNTHTTTHTRCACCAPT